MLLVIQFAGDRSVLQQGCYWGGAEGIISLVVPVA